MSARDGHYVLDPNCREHVSVRGYYPLGVCMRCARRPINLFEACLGAVPARKNNRATVSRPRSLDVPIPRGPYDAIVANVIVEMHRLLLGRCIPHTCAGWAPWYPPAPHAWRLLLDERASIDGVVCNGCGQVIP